MPRSGYTFVQTMDLHAWAWAAIRQITQYLREDSYWSQCALEERQLHLGVFVEPFLSLMLGGRKSLESRFSRRQCEPFRRVNRGDVLLLKHAGGPVAAIGEVANTWFFDTRSTPLDALRARFGKALCVDDAFWESRQHSAYATILEVQAVRALPPIPCPKRDRRGWVVFERASGTQLALPLGL
jgi:hypothetical protein